MRLLRRRSHTNHSQAPRSVDNMTIPSSYGTVSARKTNSAWHQLHAIEGNVLQERLRGRAASRTEAATDYLCSAANMEQKMRPVNLLGGQGDITGLPFRAGESARNGKPVFISLSIRAAAGRASRGRAR